MSHITHSAHKDGVIRMSTEWCVTNISYVSDRLIVTQSQYDLHLVLLQTFPTIPQQSNKGVVIASLSTKVSQ